MYKKLQSFLCSFASFPPHFSRFHSVFSHFYPNFQKLAQQHVTVFDKLHVTARNPHSEHPKNCQKSLKILRFSFCKVGVWPHPNHCPTIQCTCSYFADRCSVFVSACFAASLTPCQACMPSEQLFSIQGLPSFQAGGIRPPCCAAHASFLLLT